MQQISSIKEHTEIKQKISLTTKSTCLIIVSLFVLFALIWINILLLNESSETIYFKDLINTLIFGIKRTHTSQENIAQDIASSAPIQRSLWICLSSLIAAVSLVISGCLIQTVTQNPLADTTTLGFLSSTIFGVILMKGVISNTIEASNYHILYFIFAFIGGLFTLFILSFIFRHPQNHKQHTKIILIGLVLDMIFKTLTFLIKTYNSNAVNASFALAMGGSENIYGLYTNQFVSLKVCAVIILIIFLSVFICSQKLNLYELGEEQAKTLGVNVKVFKFLVYALILITATISILFIGNMAFLGLICTHAVRRLLNTRKYQIILPIGSLLGCVLILFGIMIHSFLPFVSSSIFILFLGGCSLLSLTLKNKNL